MSDAAKQQNEVSPEQQLLTRFAEVAQHGAQLSSQISAWVSSAANCLELGDMSGFKNHIDIAEGFAANLSSIMAAKVGWKDMLKRMREKGSRPAVTTMLAVVDKANGEVTGASWWTPLEASSALGKCGTPGAQTMVCIVIPVSYNPSESTGPKLVI